MLHRFGSALALLLLAACAGKPVRPPHVAQGPTQVPRASLTGSVPAVNHCAPTRVHRDSDYTAGGLYAPGVADGGPAAPIDVSSVLEPVPLSEPPSRRGNRSPYAVLGKAYHVLPGAGGYSERGLASWYGVKFNGRATSSGELYDMCVFSAAHKTLPLPSFVRVTNLDNGRSLTVRVNDRGPFHSGRIMDLSYAAAVRLGVDRTGTARVQLQAFDVDGRLAAPSRSDRSSPAPSVAADRSPVRLRTAVRNSSSKTVQVGSFGDQTNARRLVDRLQDEGVDNVDVFHASIAGRDVWRVQIVPVALEQVARLLERLRQLGLPHSHVLGQ